MSETKHTPGPWRVEMPGKIVGHSDKCVVKNQDHFDWVAIVQSSNVPEWEANAKLISAAPELLAIAIRVSNINRIAREHISDEFFEDVNEVIKKATL